MEAKPIKYENHPLADIFPMMEEKELQKLADDIKVNGQQEAGLIYEGKILDGRNRYAACLVAGVEMEFAEYEPSENGSGFCPVFDPLAYVLSHNLHRRHLTTSQRSDVAAKVATMRQGTRTDLASKDAKSIDEAAAQMKVSPASVQRAKKVHAKGSESVKKALADGSLPVTTAAAFVDAVPDKAEQEAIVAQGPAAVKEAAKTVPKKVAKGSGVPEREPDALPSKDDPFFEEKDHVAAVHSLTKLGDEWLRKIKVLTADKGGEYLAFEVQEIDDLIKGVQFKMRQATFAHVCVTCDGKGTKCNKCKQLGWLCKGSLQHLDQREKDLLEVPS